MIVIQIKKKFEKVDTESNSDLVTHKPSSVECVFATLFHVNTFTSASEYSRQMNQKLVGQVV